MSKEKLLEQIAHKAESEAESIKLAAVNAAAESKAKAVAEFDAEYNKKIALINEDAERLIAGQTTLMRLSSQKEELVVKRELLNEVYRLTKEKILQLSDKEYCEFVSRLIKDHAEEGDEVIICKRDSARLNKDWLSDLAFDLQLTLHLSNEFHNDDGGVILRGSKYDKNLTVSAIIFEAREKTERDVAKRLFR